MADSGSRQQQVQCNHAADLTAAGFAHAPRIETVVARSHAASAQDAALAYCQGTPLRNEIKSRAGPSLAEATAACAAELRFLN